MVIDAQAIEEAWERCATGGYNCGCCVFFLADGVIIKKQAEETRLPPGAISFDGLDQYCACASTTQVVQMVFDENAIMDALGKKFDDLGYSLKYHKALMEASKQTRPESTFKRNMPSCVQEALPKRMRKPINFKDLFWEEWNDGKLYAMDPDTREYYSLDEWAQYKYLKQQQIFASWEAPPPAAVQMQEAPPPAAVQMQEGDVTKDGRWRWSVKSSTFVPNREEIGPILIV